MFIMAVGHSDDPSISEAISELIEQCEEQLQGHTPQAGILFAALDLEYQEILDGILERYPNLELVGCSTAGEMSMRLGYQRDSICLGLFYSDQVEFHAGVGRNLPQGAEQITQSAFQHLIQSSSLSPRLCLLFPEANYGLYSDVLSALAPIAGQLPIVGGGAGGDSSTLRTYQFYKSEVLQNSVPMLLISGELHLSHGFASGWHPLGNSGEVTEAEENVICEIDHLPAHQFYRHYYNTFAPDNAYPLAIFPPGEERFILRACLSHEEETGHLLVGGSVPTRSKVQITSVSQEDIITATQHSYEDAIAAYPGKQPSAALFFSCVWRSWTLGTQTHREFKTVNSHISAMGFYTFGEIAPLSTGGQSFVHNTTFVTLLMGTD